MILNKICYTGSLLLLAGCSPDHEAGCYYVGTVTGTSQKYEKASRYDDAFSDARGKALELGGNVFKITDTYSDEDVTTVVIMVKKCKE